MFDIPKANTFQNTSVAQFSNDHITIHQFEYPSQLYKSELIQHNKSLEEYDLEIFETFVESLELNKPNIELYKQQPYLTFSIRLKLIDFLLKMSIRLKILPFVFYKAVKIFDRYCSKRIVLLDQSQLIITTCLWIASKLQGGNNHFINLNNLDKVNSIKSINDLGYGSGGKFKGPTERFRLPKLHELVKLCGAKCKYDQGMFKQMELHVLSTLDWNFNDPSIEEFITYSHEFNVLKDNEFFKIKEFLSYISLYSYELIDINVIDMSKVLIDLINETLNLSPNDYFYQRINYSEEIDLDAAKYNFIKKSLIKSILNSSEFILKLFGSKGPQQFFYAILSIYKYPCSPSPLAMGSHNGSISSASSNRSQNSSTSNINSNTPPSSSAASSIPSNHQINTQAYNNFQSPASTPKNSAPMGGMGTGGVAAATQQKQPTASVAVSSSVVAPPKGYHGVSTASPQPVFKPVVLQNLSKYSPTVEMLPNIVTNSNGGVMQQQQVQVQQQVSAHTGGLHGMPHPHYSYKHQVQQHQHNNSQTSLTSSVSSSKDHDYNSIFEYDPRKYGISTPLSDEESPMLPLVKPQNVHSH